MFHKVRVLNKNGKLLKVIKSEVLSNRHWHLFEKKLKPSPGKKKFNSFKKKSNKAKSYLLNIDNFGLEGY